MTRKWGWMGLVQAREAWNSVPPSSSTEQTTPNGLSLVNYSVTFPVEPAHTPVLKMRKWKCRESSVSPQVELGLRPRAPKSPVALPGLQVT